ncbi:MAG: hypothetical protein AB1631_16935 [Acidobacteriota bacterium]
MKIFILTVLIAVSLTGSVVEATGSSSRIDKAIAQFDEPVKLMGVVLKGRYLFLHHEGLMQKGKPCTYAYALDGEHPGRFVLSFHCEKVAREKTAELKVILSPKDLSGMAEIVEIQFPGAAEGHRVAVMH